MFPLVSVSKKISLKKLSQLAKKLKVTTLSSKGMVIWEKRLQDEVLNTSHAKRGKTADDSKGKETMTLPEAKKMKPNKLASRERPQPVALGEGTSTKPSDVLRPTTSMLGSPSVAKKILTAVILRTNKEKVDKLSLDEIVIKFFHIVG